MNELISKLNVELRKNNLGCVVKKETITLLHCYLYDLNEYTKCGIVKDYTGCKKLDVTYTKQELVCIIDNGKLNSFSKREKENYDMAKRLNMLR